MTQIDVEKVMKLLVKAQQESDPEQWLEAKSIDAESCSAVMDSITEQAMERIMGKLSMGASPQQIMELVRNAVGTGVQLGYTTAELQMEEGFTAEPKED